MLTWEIVAVAFVLLAVVRRYIFNPKFTAAAVEHYIVHSITTHPYEDFTNDHVEVWEWLDRKLNAHWKSLHSTTSPGSYIVEFDVHPGIWIFTVSKSFYVLLRNKEHFEQLRAAYLAGQYTDNFLTPEERETMRRHMAQVKLMSVI